MPTDLSPLAGPTLGVLGAFCVILANLGLRRRKSEEWYEAFISIGAFLILVGFLYQALPYIPSLEEGTNRLIANLSIIGASLAYTIFVIVWYKYQHAKKSPPKNTGKPEIEHTQANQIPSTEAAQGSLMKNIWKSWRFIAVILLIVLPTVVQLFIPPALWILILIAIGAIIIFIGSFITDTRELPDTKSKLAYLVVAIVFFVALPISLYLFINPIINSGIKFSTELGQGLLTASTVLLLLAVAGTGIITTYQKPIEKKMWDLIKLFQFVSLLFGFLDIAMILRWFILGGNELLANIILLFCYQMSSTLVTSVAFITSPKEQQESK